MLRHSAVFLRALRCIRPATGCSSAWDWAALSETAPFRWIISLDASVEYCRELFEGDLPWPGGAGQLRTPCSDGAGRVGRGRDAWYGDDDGEGAGGVGACRVRAVQRRAADQSRSTARRARTAPASPGRALS